MFQHKGANGGWDEEGWKGGFMYRKREKGSEEQRGESQEKTDKVVKKVKQEEWTEIE